MRKVIHSMLGGVIFLVFITSCNKKEKMTPRQMLEGKWLVESSEILGAIIAGDGSYLIFNECASECMGTDYKSSDSTSGTFTYIFNNGDTEIVIVDTTNEGGNYNATWDIIKLTDTDFRIITNTILGTLKVDLKKD